MKAGLRALLSVALDYAGLFPPAKLSLDETVHNYFQYRTQSENWMLGRLICPASRLGELRQVSARLAEENTTGPWHLSVLGRRALTRQEYEDSVGDDFLSIANFQRSVHSRFIVADSYEASLPPGSECLSPAELRSGLIVAAVEEIETSDLRRMTAYFEMEYGPQWKGSLERVVAGLQQENQRIAAGTASRKCRRTGFKLRCGGLEASAFPTPEQVAHTITSCRDAGVLLKFTAGLHHPIRRFDASVQTHMHGFLNVFVAGVLAHARGLGEEQVRLIMEDEDPASFRFDDDGLSWKTFRATVPEIETARRQAVISFGSCSFDEPREDLRALGLLP